MGYIWKECATVAQLHHCCLVRKYKGSGSQVLGPGTSSLEYADGTIIDFDSLDEVTDIGGLYTPSVDSLTIQQDGMYRVSFHGSLYDTGVGPTLANIHMGIDGAQVHVSGVTVGTSLIDAIGFELIMGMSAGNVIDFRGNTDSGETVYLFAASILVSQLQYLN
jgi:hypothetical protein